MEYLILSNATKRWAVRKFGNKPECKINISIISLKIWNKEENENNFRTVNLKFWTETVTKNLQHLISNMKERGTVKRIYKHLNSILLSKNYIWNILSQMWNKKKQLKLEQSFSFRTKGNSKKNIWNIWSQVWNKKHLKNLEHSISKEQIEKVNRKFGYGTKGNEGNGKKWNI